MMRPCRALKACMQPTSSNYSQSLFLSFILYIYHIDFESINHLDITYTYYCSGCNICFNWVSACIHSQGIKPTSRTVATATQRADVQEQGANRFPVKAALVIQTCIEHFVLSEI